MEHALTCKTQKKSKLDSQVKWEERKAEAENAFMPHLTLFHPCIM